jgi:hypothetical protein
MQSGTNCLAYLSVASEMKKKSLITQTLGDLAIIIFGASTFSITTLSIMTFSIVTFSITTLSITVD